MNAELKQILEASLEVEIIKTENVPGGDINETFLIQTNKGMLFIKLNDHAEADMFEKEYKGLELLKNTNSIYVPQPIITGKGNRHIFLVMEHVSKGLAAEGFWQIFGQQLAALHKNTAKRFGLAHDNYIGSISQRNSQSDSWSEFYAEHRILYLVRKAFDEKKCESSDARMAEKLCSKFDSLFPKENPSLLHGDLWSGNFMSNDKGNPVIYDPAVYYGHREMDIGMALLFGGFDRSFYDHYNEAWPMERNWRQRVDLTQLYPLLVHLMLFGGHYYHSVRNVLKKYA